MGDPKVSITRGGSALSSPLEPGPWLVGCLLQGCQGPEPSPVVSSHTGGTRLAEWLPAQADALAGCQDMTRPPCPDLQSRGVLECPGPCGLLLPPPTCPPPAPPAGYWVSIPPPGCAQQHLFPKPLQSTGLHHLTLHWAFSPLWTPTHSQALMGTFSFRGGKVVGNRALPFPWGPFSSSP